MKLLDIYYYIDIGKTQDINYIKKCLEIYIKTKCNNYTINRYEEYILDKKLENNDNKADIIKNGIDIFNQMYDKLPLKSSHDLWFFYISNGNIKDKYKDVSVVLLNKNPMIKRTNYVINRNIIDIDVNYTKEKKLDGTKCFTNSLNHLFNSNKTIEYN